MAKLTLSADPETIEQAKRLAKESGTSVSALFARMVRALSAQRPRKAKLGRLTRRASGLIQFPPGKDEDDILAEALTEKYGFKK